MPKKTPSITNLTKEEFVSLMKKSGFKDANIELLESDISLGAPLNEDGTINLFDFAAWLYIYGYNKGESNV